ncbi:hypothetical protein [Paenibacillus sp. TSA_86.1]|uniref:hypothetical protein n=1 Tax=Paenibacillus sp. TSA_86.1 TaxID=3415649 RepID=UPI00404534CC
MIGISVIQENELGVFTKKQLLQSEYDRGLYFIDDLDFNTHSINDFYDYLEFHDITDYVFISEGKRIQNLVQFLNNNQNIRFHLCDSNFNHKEGEITTINSVKRDFFEILCRFQDSSSSNWGMQLKNGIRFWITGFYPYEFRNGLIKHIYIYNIELLNVISNDIIMNSAINSAIIIDNTDEIGSLCHPLICLNLSEIKKNEHLTSTQLCSKKDIQSVINYFESTSVIDNSSKIQGIIDYASIMDIDRNNRLFYHNHGIYRDYQGNQKVTDLLSSSYLSLMNKRSYLKKNPANPLWDIVPLLINISAHLDGDQTVFITPFSKYFLQQTVSEYTAIKFIGIINSNTCYVYNTLTNQMFRVNKPFLVFLEYYLKGQLHSSELVSKFSNYDKILDKFNYFLETN